jgi:hypothetical protein
MNSSDLVFHKRIIRDLETYIENVFRPSEYLPPPAPVEGLDDVDKGLTKLYEDFRDQHKDSNRDEKLEYLNNGVEFFRDKYYALMIPIFEAQEDLLDPVWGVFEYNNDLPNKDERVALKISASWSFYLINIIAKTRVWNS